MSKWTYLIIAAGNSWEAMERPKSVVAGPPV